MISKPAATMLLAGTLVVSLSGAAASAATGSAPGPTACPTTPIAVPPGGPPPALYAKTVAPSDTSTSIVIRPDGPQIRCGKTQLSTYSNIVYSAPVTAGKQVRLVMDIQVPQTPGPKPLVVFLPGGGFMVADPSGNLDQRTYVAEHGYVVASVQYRTIPDGATYKDGLADIKSAIRYLRAHATSYGIDPREVAVWGQSAGGYMAAMTGVDRSSAVQAVVDQFGPSDLTKIAADFDPADQAGWASVQSITTEYVLGPGNTKTLAQEPAAAAAADPITYVKPGDPPFVLFHGSDDHIVSPSQTLLLLDALRAKGVDSTRYVVEGANHGGLTVILGDTPANLKADQMWSTRKVMGDILSFLYRHIGRLPLPGVRFQNSATGPGLGFYAARVAWPQ
jgi:acetyl esterase/lipase